MSQRRDISKALADNLINHKVNTIDATDMIYCVWEDTLLAQEWDDEIINDMLQDAIDMLKAQNAHDMVIETLEANHNSIAEALS